ncbi:hypothetical protein [Micromonospora peucetia]|uniref:Secreted protein n=1 Tax=Micromonospora peucetia TaxID=47871 RepID=A0ABZ1E9B0_9ACTN|nr:hypothetical protein [Micromonospora peucetia]WSA30358.1 hypothetical protein OIE14_19355 [Micromonospora peucetia]
MKKRYVGLLAVIVGTAFLAVIGTLGGWYLADGTAPGPADLTASGPADPMASGPAAPTAAAGGGTGSPSTGSRTSGPASSESPSKEQPAARTYQIDRLVYDQAGLTVRLVSAEITGGKLRLNLRYRNGSSVAWPVSCPTVEVDRTSSEIVLPDGRSVRPESTWCATTRAGESFSIAAGEQVDSWGAFPVAPEAGSSFELTWYDFPSLDVRLR